MPEMTGLELAAALKQSESKTRVIILTTFARPGYLRRALDAGARGYLLKERPVTELAEAIRRVHQGLRAVDPHSPPRPGPPTKTLSPTRAPDPATRRRRPLLLRDRLGNSTSPKAPFATTSPKPSPS